MNKCPDFPFRFIIGSQTETDGRKHPLAGRVYMYLTSRITGGLSAPAPFQVFSDPEAFPVTGPLFLDVSIPAHVSRVLVSRPLNTGFRIDVE